MFKKLVRNATDVQQYFYEISSNWNVFEENQNKYLKNYIGGTIFGPPQTENFIDIDGLYIYEEQQSKLIDLIFNKIILYSSNIEQDGSSKKIYCAVLYNVLFPDRMKVELLEKHITIKRNIRKENKNSEQDRIEMEQMERDLIERLIFCIPIFKVKVNAQTMGTCTWFIDTSGRLYKDWEDYIKNNTLSKCTMVVPKDGSYQPHYNMEYTSKKSSVWVECFQSPACNVTAILVNAGNKISNLLTVVSFGIGALGAFTPVAPTVALAGTVTTALSALWSISRSSAILKDRDNHDQSLVDKEAVRCWLEIGYGAVGVLSVGTQAIAMINRGTKFKNVSQIATKIMKRGHMSSQLTLACTNDISRKRKLTQIDIKFYMQDVYFTCNFILNYEIASQITASDSYIELIELHKNNLRNKRHETASKYLQKQTTNYDVVRTITIINNKNELFTTVVNSLRASNPYKLEKVTICNETLVSYITDVMTIQRRMTHYLDKDKYNTIPLFIDILDTVTLPHVSLMYVKHILQFAVMLSRKLRNPEGNILIEIIEYVWKHLKQRLLSFLHREYKLSSQVMCLMKQVFSMTEVKFATYINENVNLRMLNNSTYDYY